MHRTFAVLLLIAALTLPAACTDSGGKQLPCTAAELDKFAADNAPIIQAVRQAMRDMSAGLVLADHPTLKRAKDRKIKELGWDVDRYYSIYQKCCNALSLESLRRNNALRKQKLRENCTVEARQAYQKDFQRTSASIKKLEKTVDRTTTVAERVLIHERREALRKDFDGPVEVFFFIH